MAPNVLHIVNVCIGFLSWIFCVVAMATDDGVLTGTGFTVGLFKSKTGGWTFDTSDMECSEASSHIKAAQAFAIMAILIMSFVLIVDILLLVPSVGSRIEGMLPMGRKLLAIPCAVSAFFLLIVWAVLAGFYNETMCETTFKDFTDLNYGFAFFIICMVFEIIRAVLHVVGSGATSTKVVMG
ncbi:hypothetical protein DIPPA_31804 [Diplonema papillatum]|nr:hypothetical protein DIPPA_31804 [Diplonema papillatum]